MITFDQLKDVLLQGETEILSDVIEDNKEYSDAVSQLTTEFDEAKYLHDIIVIFEDRGYETYEVNEKIIETLMQVATIN